GRRAAGRTPAATTGRSRRDVSAKRARLLLRRVSALGRGWPFEDTRITETRRAEHAATELAANHIRHALAGLIACQPPGLTQGRKGGNGHRHFDQCFAETGYLATLIAHAAGQR